MPDGLGASTVIAAYQLILIALSVGQVTSRKFVRDDCDISPGMRIRLTETFLSKIFSVSARKLFSL